MHVRIIYLGPKVWWLRLSHNFIGDNGARALSTFLSQRTCPIYALDISDNKISLIGAHILSSALRDANRSLGVLRAQLNEFGEEGARSFISSIKNNSNIMVCDLPYHNIRPIYSQLHGVLNTNRRATFILARMELKGILGKGSTYAVNIILAYIHHDAFRSKQRAAL